MLKDNQQLKNIIKLLESRGVSVRAIAEIVLILQEPYVEGLTIEQCDESVIRVLNKREIQFALYTGIAIDQLAEEGKLPEPLQTIIANDEPLYGIDEILAIGVTNVYGSIGLTSFGFLDKQKTGIIKQLDTNPKRINTFLDDLVAAIAAAASARTAHKSINSIIDADQALYLDPGSNGNDD